MAAHMAFNIFRSSIFAGIAIAVGGTVFLNVGGISGAVMFTFGLITVVHYRLKLYTGTAGWVSRNTWGQLALILLGNIVGCALSAAMIRYSQPHLIEAADAIVAKRLSLGATKCFIQAIGCGLLMITAVRFAREGKYLPMLFAVPVFIMCGFAHSIADAFYYSLATPTLWTPRLGLVYAVIVLGNLAGCNLYRLFIDDSLSS